MRRWAPLRKEGELEVVDDPIYHGIFGEERDDPHLTSTPGTDHRVEEGGHVPYSREFGTCPLFFSDGPALGGQGSELPLHYREKEKPQV